MQIVPGGVVEQTEQVLKNLKAVVEAGGSELGKVAKTTVSIPISFLLGFSSNHLLMIGLGFLEVDG